MIKRVFRALSIKLPLAFGIKRLNVKRLEENKIYFVIKRIYPLIHCLRATHHISATKDCLKISILVYFQTIFPINPLIRYDNNLPVANPRTELRTNIDKLPNDLISKKKYRSRDSVIICVVNLVGTLNVSLFIS